MEKVDEETEFETPDSVKAEPKPSYAQAREARKQPELETQTKSPEPFE